MALDAKDQARLRAIEGELAMSDPALATTFRRWASGSGWSRVSAWMVVVFVVGFVSWVVSPTVGVVAMVVGGCWLMRRRVSGGPHRRTGRGAPS